MGDFLAIAVLAVLIVFFWQLRQMAELSQVHAVKECKRQNIQLLSVAMSKAVPCLGGNSGFTWRANYIIEFSTNGINSIKADMIMCGKRVEAFKWPIYPEPQWDVAPQARGKCGSGCGRCG